MTSSFKHKIKNLLPNAILEPLVYLKHVREQLPNRTIFLTHVEGKKGIEIGGPSTLFKTILPIYQKVATLDGVNFSNDTVWEGKIQAGQSFNYIGNKTGHQFISDATGLSAIEPNS